MSYKFSAIFLFLISCLSVALLVLLFWPITVVKANVQPYKVLTPVVQRGGELVYQIDSCKYVAVTATVYRQYVKVAGDVEYPGIQAPNNIQIGCRKTDVSTEVPLYIPPGIYYLNLSVNYQVNPLRDINYNFTTEKFTVE